MRGLILGMASFVAAILAEPGSPERQSACIIGSIWFAAAWIREKRPIPTKMMGE